MKYGAGSACGAPYDARNTPPVKVAYVSRWPACISIQPGFRCAARYCDVRKWFRLRTIICRQWRGTRPKKRFEQHMPRTLAHDVCVSGYGGVEKQSAQFAARATAIPALQQTVVACSKTIHPHHRATLTHVDGVWREKAVAGIRLPQRPAGLRRARYR